MRLQPEGIFIDFYGTITDGDREAVEKVCAIVVHDHNLPVRAEEFAVQWGEAFFAEIDRSNGENFRTMFECECRSLTSTLRRYGLDADPRPYVEMLREYWRNPPLLEGVAETLEKISLPKCLLSNADTADLAAAIENLGLRFEFVVTSQDARSYKPHPAIFEKALELTGWNPARTVHIGDSLYSDVLGARRVGISTIWLNRPGRISDIGKASPDFTVRSFAEILQIIGNEKCVPGNCSGRSGRPAQRCD